MPEGFFIAVSYAQTSQWRIARQSLAKSADSSSVEYGYTLPRFRLDLAATLPRTASTCWIKAVSAARLTNLTCHGIFCWWRKLPYITWYTSFTTFGALLFYLTKVIDSIIL